jgi:membrane fusion protein (multidrug efflux system)
MVLALLGCAEEPPPPAPPEVRVAEVIQRDQPIVIEMVGETRGSADIPIRARVEGVLLTMSFIEGRRVEEGQILYTIDPVPFESKVVEAEGNLAEARTRLAKAKADLDRIRPLAEMNAVSQQDLDGAVAQYEAALGAVQAAEARKEQAEIELGYTRIAAPISGRIGISQAKVGEFVGRSPNPVVLNYVSLTDPIRVRFAIDERSYLRIARKIRDLEETGQLGTERADIELVLADGTVHEGRGVIVGADAAVNPQTGTFTLEADFPNPRDIVVAGQFARVRAVAETIEDALLVPQRAITELQGMFRVYVVGDDGEVALREVELGPKVDRLQVVVSGLEAGERVAVDTMRLRAGLKVVPVLDEGDQEGADPKDADADSQEERAAEPTSPDAADAGA